MKTCQDVSAAGKRAGIKDGTRSGLWAVFADAIDALRPRYVVIENVRGLLSATAHRDMESDDAAMGDGSDRPVLRALGAVLGDLSDIGYDAVWATVAAADVGAPHRRERVFIVATATDAPIGSGNELQQQDLSALQQRRGNRRQRQSGVCDCGDAACGSNAAGSSHKGWDSGDEPGRIGWIGHRDRYGVPYASNADTEPEPGVALQPTPKLNAEVTLLSTPQARDYKGKPSDGFNTANLCRDVANTAQWGNYAPAIARWENLTRPAPAPTEPNRNGKPRLAASFAEWMMGWPDGWVTNPEIGLSRPQQLRMIGNGVVPQQAVAALRKLLED